MSRGLVCVPWWKIYTCVVATLTLVLAQAIALHLEEKYEDAIAALGDDIENKAPSLVKRSRCLCVQYLMCAVHLAQGLVTALTVCVCVCVSMYVFVTTTETDGQ